MSWYMLQLHAIIVHIRIDPGLGHPGQSGHSVLMHHSTAAQLLL